MMTMTAFVFELCHAMISIERPIKINKFATGLLAGSLMWTL